MDEVCKLKLYDITMHLATDTAENFEGTVSQTSASVDYPFTIFEMTSTSTPSVSAMTNFLNQCVNPFGAGIEMFPITTRC